MSDADRITLIAANLWARLHPAPAREFESAPLPHAYAAGAQIALDRVDNLERVSSR